MKNFDDKFLDYLDEMEFDTVELSKEELQRIHKTELHKIESEKAIKPKFKWKMAYGLVAACIIMVVSARVIVPKLNHEVIKSPQVVNPYMEYSDLASTKKALGYDIMLPQRLPTGYKQTNVSVIGNELLSITYTNDINNIIYRTAQGSSDISGDYTNYTNKKIIHVKDMSVTLKGNNDKICLATWKTDGQTFSINTIKGLSQSEIIKIIENVEKN